MLKHNAYFDGDVQSVGFERLGRRATVGVIDVGTFHFGTDAPERMTVVSGELEVKRDGAAAFQTYPAGTSFEIAGKSGFDVRAAAPAAYLCELLLATAALCGPSALLTVHPCPRSVVAPRGFVSSAFGRLPASTGRGFATPILPSPA